MQKSLFFILITSVGGSRNIDEDDLFNEIRRGDEEILTKRNRTYTANWFDLDSRLTPPWYDQAKIGILLHWGIYSVPAFHSEWFWYWLESDLPKRAHKEVKRFMDKTFRVQNPNFRYEDFAEMFKAKKFDPDRLALKLREAGAKYVILTSKHHDGFALFPSEQSPKWNSVDVGPHRDLVGEIAVAVRKQYMIFGVQYSLYEWFHPLYMSDREDKFANRTYPDTKIWPELKAIVNRYGPSVIRADGDKEATSSYWHSEEFLAWLFNKSPVRYDVVVNDGWGRDVHCKHGNFFRCVDRLNPFRHKWENAFSMDKQSWSYRRDMEWDEVVPMKEILEIMADTVSCGGNVLINIGLTRDGEIPELFQENLQYLGYWLSVNGEAIYKSSPWFHPTDSARNDVRYTCTKEEYNVKRPTAMPRKTDTIKAVYAIFFDWPHSNKMKLKAIAPYFRNDSYRVLLLGHPLYLKWTLSKTRLIIELPEKKISNRVTLDIAWVLKFTKGPPLREKPRLIVADTFMVRVLKRFYSSMLQLLRIED